MSRLLLHSEWCKYTKTKPHIKHGLDFPSFLPVTSLTGKIDYLAQEPNKEPVMETVAV